VTRPARSTERGTRRATRDAVFRALGDPTRRAILDRLRHRERPVSELCAPFAMSQPAISQHLKVLADAGLVTATRCGRERVYRLRAAPLRDAHDWLGHFEQFWPAKLDNLAAYLDGEPDDPGEVR
jgi:DNA-binding transcriptional ArsR family regulator